MKTTGKEFFYLVSGLMPPKYIVSDMLVEHIEYFVDWVPQNAKKLEFLLENMGDAKSFVTRMEDLYMQLCAIHAHWLEMEAARILRLAEINESNLCRKLLIPFIANLNTLALDIQMAQNQGFETSYRQRDDIERYRGAISSMKVLFALMEGGDFEKAFDLAMTINDLQESEYVIPIMSCITSKNMERADFLINKVIELFNKKIEDVISTATETIVLKKVMIVDDMPEMLAALSYMLKGHYQVFAFPSAKEALNFIDFKQQPEAFLLDIDMPEMDGFTLAKRIRERPQHARTPILFLTGVSTRETLMKSMMYDAKAFIVKPANKAIIISKLSSCLTK